MKNTEKIQITGGFDPTLSELAKAELAAALTGLPTINSGEGATFVALSSCDSRNAITEMLGDHGLFVQNAKSTMERI